MAMWTNVANHASSEVMLTQHKNPSCWIIAKTV